MFIIVSLQLKLAWLSSTKSQISSPTTQLLGGTVIQCWSLSDMSFGCQLMLCRKAESGGCLDTSRSMLLIRFKGLMDEVDRANDWVTFEVPSSRKSLGISLWMGE